MNREYRTRKGLKLRKIGTKNLIVRLSDDRADLSEVFTLNPTAARLWQTLESNGPQSAEALAASLGEEYSLSPAAVLEDVNAQLRQWEDYGLIES